MSRKSPESSGSEDSSPTGMPMGGMHIRMGPGGVSVDAAPGLPVDMAVGGPLIQAVMQMLAKKDAELGNQTASAETVNHPATSSSSMEPFPKTEAKKKEDTEKIPEDEDTEKTTNQKKQKKRSKKTKGGKKKGY